MNFLKRIFSKEDSVKQMVDILTQIKTFLLERDNMSFDGISPAELGMDIEVIIDQLKNNEKIDKGYLIALFAPTAPIQECAMANDWTDQYLKLADRFDQHIIKI